MIQVLDQEGVPYSGLLSSPKCSVVIRKDKLKHVLIGDQLFLAVGGAIELDLADGNEWDTIRKTVQLEIHGEDWQQNESIRFLVARPPPQFKLKSNLILHGKPILKAGPNELIMSFTPPLRSPPIVDVMFGRSLVLSGLQCQESITGDYPLTITIPKHFQEGEALVVPHGTEQDGHRF